MICENCGKESFSAGNVCEHCGKSLLNSEKGNPASTSERVNNEDNQNVNVNQSINNNVEYQNTSNQNTYNSYNSSKTVNDYLAWSIVTLIFSTILCCCLAVPTGIVALVYSSKVSTYLLQGNFILAEDASRKAKIWNIVGTCILALWPILIIFNCLFSWATVLNYYAPFNGVFW